MPKTDPLWCRAGAIEATLEVAHWLFVLADSDTESNHVATHRHIGALVDLAMLAARELADDLCDMEDKLEEVETAQANHTVEASPC